MSKFLVKYATTLETDPQQAVEALKAQLGPAPADAAVLFFCYINQVVLNIVVNAAHAIADVVKGTEDRGRITVRTRSVDPQTVLIEISDTGGGIPEHIRERIFEPFFTTKEVGRGTGQGLAISRSVMVDKHGGSLGFETELKKGTTFRIYLPVHPPVRKWLLKMIVIRRKKR